MKSLYQILNIDPIIINVIDLGARELAPGGKSPFGNIPDECIGKVFGFEPDRPTCDSLNASSPANYHYLPHAVFDGSVQNLYLTKSPLVSSLYEPDFEIRKLFGSLYHLAQIKEIIPMQTSRLDDISEIDVPIDFIKADVQGSEKVIFHNSKSLLEKVSVIQTEVFIIPLYKNMPLSGDIDVELRSQDFYYHKAWGPQGRTFSPLVSARGPLHPLSQYTAQDVVYVKRWHPESISKFNQSQLLKMALILHDLYKSVDLVHYLLEVSDRNFGTEYSRVYRDHLHVNSCLLAGRTVGQI